MARQPSLSHADPSALPHLRPQLDKRLLHVTRSIAPALGGPAEGIRNLAHACGENSGMELVSLDDPSAEYVHGESFPIHALGPAKGHYGYTPRLEPWLKANLARFDGVVIHGLWQYQSYRTYRAIRERAAYAIFPHGMLDPYFKRAFPLKHFKKQVYWLAREYRVLRDARAVCFTTPIERDCAAATMWPHRWTPAVVSFGTMAPSGEPDRQRAAFLDRFPDLAERRFFLFLSRIHIKKGCDLAIQAFARIAPSQPDLDLVIAGPDETGLQPALQAQAAALNIDGRVHWTGMLQGDEKWGAFYAAEAFVLPSHQENFGVAAVESLAAQLPILISNQVNIWPDVLADQAGIIDDDTAEGTWRSMTAFLKMSAEERLQMKANGLRCFNSRYEITRTAKALNDLF
jgi:glycosyltransferase involved in cell wall biosynthesis